MFYLNPVLFIIAIVITILMAVYAAYHDRTTQKIPYQYEDIQKKMYENRLYNPDEFTSALWEAVESILYTLKTQYQFNQILDQKLDEIIAMQIIRWIDEYGNQYQLINPRLIWTTVHLAEDSQWTKLSEYRYAMVAVDIGIGGTGLGNQDETVTGIIDFICPCYMEEMRAKTPPILYTADELVEDFYQRVKRVKSKASPIYHPVHYQNLSSRVS